MSLGVGWRGVEGEGRGSGGRAREFATCYRNVLGIGASVNVLTGLNCFVFTGSLWRLARQAEGSVAAESTSVQVLPV